MTSFSSHVAKYRAEITLTAFRFISRSWKTTIDKITRYRLRNVASYHDYLSTSIERALKNVPCWKLFLQAEVAEHYGYQSETHSVTTPDGYVLTVHRLKNGSVELGEPFIMQHGITANSGQWLILEPSQNLGNKLNQGR